jgi:site-specific DNA recombinase
VEQASQLTPSRPHCARRRVTNTGPTDPLRHPRIARGRQWLSEIEAGALTIDGIALRESCSKRHVNMTISLAFLAPSLVKAAVEGRLPQGIGVARLFDAPVDWSRQHRMLGLAH